MYELDLEEAVTKLPELLSKADSGEEIVITRKDGKAFKLVPVTSSFASKRHIIGIAKGQVRMAEDFDEPLEDFDTSITKVVVA